MPSREMECWLARQDRAVEQTYRRMQPKRAVAAADPKPKPTMDRRQRLAALMQTCIALAVQLEMEERRLRGEQ